MKFLLLLLLPMQVLAQKNAFVFTNVNTVDVERGIINAKQNVLIVGNRIAVVSAKPVKQNGALVIDATGKYLMPGLCDFNTTLLNSEHDGQAAFPLMLAYGVTSALSILPDQSLSEIYAIKQRINNGSLLGPRLYLSGKTIIDRRPFQNENEGRSFIVNNAKEASAAVDTMLKYGADVIDIRTILNRGILLAITKRAHQKGIKVLARFSGNWITASHDGVDAFTHISDLWRTVSKGRNNYYKFSEGDSMRFVSVTEFYNRVLPSLGTVDTSYFYRLVDTFKMNNTWLCFSAASFKPSLLKWEVGDSSRAAYRTPKQKEQLTNFLKGYADINNPQVKAAKPEISFVLMAAKRGVKLVCGTQLEDFTTPGLSMHDMLYWLVDGGMTPAEALRSATLNAALFLNRKKDMGTIGKGKLADLLLLDANPLEDINNTRKIFSVVANGKLLTRKDLDNLLKEAKQQVAHK